MIICVNNNKGGSLKTTVTTNLAGVLAKKKKKVLIIDTDNQANVALTFGVNPDNLRTSLYDVLTSPLPPEDAIISVHKYIDILPSNDDLVAFDFEVIGNAIKYPKPFFLMKRKLQHLRNNYDYILIDTSPSLSLLTGNAFNLADRIIIPYAPEYYSMRSLTKVANAIGSFTADNNPDLKILGVLCTLVNNQTNLHTDILQKTRVYALENNINIFSTVIPRTVQFANTVAYENLPATLSKSKKIDKAYLFEEVWNEIEELLNSEGNE